MMFYDTETCGLHGVAVLIQYAEDDGDVVLHPFWTRPIIESLSLIEKLMANDVVGFNLAFDQFHLNKLYNIFAKYPDYDAYPVDIIDELAMLEAGARDGYCLKPKRSCDLMLHARKGPYQSTMDREEIRIKRVPTALAYELAAKLNEMIKLPDIYFAKSSNKTQWHVLDVRNEFNEINPEFKNVVLMFAPSTALKALAIDALKQTEVTFYKDVELDRVVYPKEYGYAPFATAGVYEETKSGKKYLMKVGPGNWRGTWPDVIHHHIAHWGHNHIARTYAEKDVIYTRDLWKFFGRPEPGDDDSELAGCVAAVRWKGFTIDKEYVTGLRDQAIAKKTKVPTSPQASKIYLYEKLNEMEQMIVDSTKGAVLAEIAKWNTADGVHEAAVRAQEIIQARGADKEIELYDKLLMAGRFHASFKVIGTLSTRMAGTDGLNPQGIKRTKVVRSGFTFTNDPGYCLCGGDFSAFEVVLADAEYNDPDLRAALLSGKKIHALFGQYVFNMTHDEILATEGTADDKYIKCKSAVFALLYGGEAFTLKTRLGVSEENAEKAYQKFISTYKKVGEARKVVTQAFCSMRQPKGIGTKVEWADPADYCESMLGFRRYFTLENKITKALFRLGENPPDQWKKLKMKIVRRDREQTVGGAVQSALFGAAFKIQAGNMRAACNHRIQSTGAQITKNIQRKIWDLQPVGINPWIVQPYNGHDEIEVVVKNEHTEQVKETVLAGIESYREKIPLIKMKWKERINTWGQK